MKRKRQSNEPENVTNLFDDMSEEEGREDDEHDGRDPEYQDDCEVNLEDEIPDANWDEWGEEDPSAYDDGPLY